MLASHNFTNKKCEKVLLDHPDWKKTECVLSKELEGPPVIHPLKRYVLPKTKQINPPPEQEEPAQKKAKEK